jgi:hypothetical protein
MMTILGTKLVTVAEFIKLIDEAEIIYLTLHNAEGCYTMQCGPGSPTYQTPSFMDLDEGQNLVLEGRLTRLMGDRTKSIHYMTQAFG